MRSYRQLSMDFDYALKTIKIDSLIKGSEQNASGKESADVVGDKLLKALEKQVKLWLKK